MQRVCTSADSASTLGPQHACTEASHRTCNSQSIFWASFLLRMLLYVRGILCTKMIGKNRTGGYYRQFNTVPEDEIGFRRVDERDYLCRGGSSGEQQARYEHRSHAPKIRE